MIMASVALLVFQKCKCQPSGCIQHSLVPASVSISFSIARLDEAEDMKYPDAEKEKAKEAKNFGNMRSEILHMQQICKKLKSPLVFTHNDLLSGNVMIPLEVSTYRPCAMQPTTPPA